MDHHQVDSSGLIERYVFGHLTPQQMEQLEAHLFECPECATELHETAMFLTNARVVLREPILTAGPAKESASSLNHRLLGAIEAMIREEPETWPWMTRINSARP